MRPKWICPNPDYLIKLYKRGSSIKALAEYFGVKERRLINRVLTKHGVRIRTQGEQERIKWTQMSKQQRKYQVAAAHATVRGMKRSQQELNGKAISRQKRRTYISPHEVKLARLLHRQGLHP